MLKTQPLTTNVLLVTRDISYPGGSERFLENFLIYGAEKHANRLNFSLFETEGGGKFVNKAVYKKLEKRGIKIYSSGVEDDDFLNTKKVKGLSSLITRNEFDIVHSALFNSDFTVLISRLGSVQSYNLLKSIPSFETLREILPSIDKLKRNRILPCERRFFWFSTKFCQFSIALEKDTKEWRERKRIIDDELEKIVSKFTDQIYVVSSQAKRKWLNFVSNSNKSKTIKTYPCCSIGKKELKFLDRIQKRRIEFRRKYKIGNKKLAICYIGRLAYGKGIKRLIEAFLSHSQKVARGMVLVIAGIGELESEMRKYKNRNNIILLGQLEREEVFEVLVATDIFCLFSESEGCSLAIQEAMAAGNPVFATDVGGNADLVDNGLTGWLCGSFNEQEISDIFKIISKIEVLKLKQMGRLARRKIENNFLREAFFENIITDYLSILK